MPVKHVDDELLLKHADNRTSGAEADEIEVHLSECSDCWNALVEWRTLSASLANDETWSLRDDSDDNESIAARIREFEIRRQAEDAEATRLLRNVTESVYRFTYSNIAVKHRYQTGGVVRLLCDAARAQFMRDPIFALALCEAATSIADRLPDNYYPAAAVNQLRGDAWKDYSTACRFLGRFQPALDALDRAERAYRRLLASDYSLATIRMARAVVYFKQERYELVAAELRAADDTFVRHRDGVRHLECRQMNANLLERLGQTEAARASFHELFEAADAVDNHMMKASAAQNLGVSYIESDPGQAAKYFVMALRLCEELGLATEVERARWGLGRVSLAVGNTADAVKRLRSTEEGFLALGMAADANRVRIDLAEALLVRGEFEEVERLCTSMVEFFRRANMLTGAHTAASFLREAAAQRTLTRPLIAHVRNYFENLDRVPDLAFAPLLT